MFTNKNKKEEKLFAETRKLSVKEGCAASIMTGSGEANVIPYALELKASNIETGLLSSLANLFGPIAQILGSRLLEKFSRKKVIIFGVILQVLSCFLFVGIGLLFLQSGKTANLIWLFILAFIFYYLTGSLAGPAWFSMIGDAVPEKMRAKYFSNRNKITGIFSVSSTVVGALILNYFKKSEIIIGFIIVFAIAGIGRLISAYWLSKHHVKPIKLEKGYYFSFWQFIKKTPNYNFNRFALYVASMRMAVDIAGPFFSVYTWNIIKLSPLWFTAINISGGIFTFLFFPIWGKFSDKYGNRELIRISSIILIFVPLFWLISKNPIYLMLFPQFLAGAGWSGFNLAASNFIYDSFGPQRRAMIISYQNLLIGAGIFIGSITGGLITQYLKVSFVNVFFILFIFSSMTRLFMFLILLPLVKEIKEYHSANKNPINYLREVKPLYGTFRYLSFPLKEKTFKFKFPKRKYRITYY